MKENTIKAVLAAFFAAVYAYLGQLAVPLVLLGAFAVLDYLTGMAKAWVSGTLSSKIGLTGILKKLSYAVMIAVAGGADWLIYRGMGAVGVRIELGFYVALVVTIWLMLNEMISILENIYAIGGPRPKWLEKLIARLKDSVDEKMGGEGDDGSKQGS